MTEQLHWACKYPRSAQDQAEFDRVIKHTNESIEIIKEKIAPLEEEIIELNKQERLLTAHRITYLEEKAEHEKLTS